MNFRPLKQTTSWETQKSAASVGEGHQRAMSCDNEPHSNHVDEGVECSEPGNWSSDASNSDDEDYIISVRLFKITHFSALFLSSV